VTSGGIMFIPSFVKICLR